MGPKMPQSSAAPIKPIAEVNMDRGILKKSQQLKRSYSTARVKLQKMLLFEFTKRLKLNFYCRCKKEITEINDFTMDHIKPWLNSEDPIGLFCDINNVLFSHLSCNCGCTSMPHRKNKIGNMYWCSGCKVYHPKEYFSITTEQRHKHRDYLRSYCNKSRKERGWGHDSRKRGRRRNSGAVSLSS